MKKEVELGNLPLCFPAREKQEGGLVGRFAPCNKNKYQIVSNGLKKKNDCIPQHKLRLRTPQNGEAYDLRRGCYCLRN